MSAMDVQNPVERGMNLCPDNATEDPESGLSIEEKVVEPASAERHPREDGSSRLDSCG
jgi:hypothetical protein